MSSQSAVVPEETQEQQSAQPVQPEATQQTQQTQPTTTTKQRWKQFVDATKDVELTDVQKSSKADALKVIKRRGRKRTLVLLKEEGLLDENDLLPKKQQKRGAVDIPQADDLFEMLAVREVLKGPQPLARQLTGPAAAIPPERNDQLEVAVPLTEHVLAHLETFGFDSKKVEDLPRDCIQRQRLKKDFAADQEVPFCSVCSHAWIPDPRKSDLQRHFEATTHQKALALQKNKGKRDEKIEKLFPKTRSTVVQKQAAHGSLFLGIPPQKLTTFTQMLGGSVIPAGGIDVTAAVKQHGPELTSATNEVIKKKMSGRPFFIIHDLGTKGEFSIHSIIVQSREASYALEPRTLKGTSFTGDELLSVTKEMLRDVGIEGTPFLIRSDRGGATGAASRRLAASWGVPFLGCPMHMLNNVVKEIQFWLEDRKNVAFVLCDLLNNLFNGQDKRVSRWKQKQEAVNKNESATIMRKAATDLGLCATKLRKIELEKLFTKKAEELLSLITDAEQKKEVESCESVADLSRLASAMATKLEKETNGGPPAKRMPLHSDTRWVHSLYSYVHIKERLNALRVFIADEHASPAACDSVQKLHDILNTFSLTALESALDEVIQVTSGMVRLFEKYANTLTTALCQRTGKWYGSAFFIGIEEYLEELQDKRFANSPLAQAAHRALFAAWNQHREHGYFFYSALRQFDPHCMRQLLTFEGDMKLEDIVQSLPLQATTEVWDEYRKLARRVAPSESLQNFWLKFHTRAFSGVEIELEKKEKALQAQQFAERVLDLLSLPVTCTQPDSLFSIAEETLTKRRNRQKAPEHWLFHRANQDVLGQYPNVLALRRGFPSMDVRRIESDEEVAEVGCIVLN